VARTVRILQVNITQSRFPNIDPAVEHSLDGAIQGAITSQGVTLSLDQLLAMLATVHKEDAPRPTSRRRPLRSSSGSIRREGAI